jgi:hypothetical protein
MVKCKACEKEFETEKELHKHIRSHDLLLVDYYQRYTPRHDLLTGDLIKFKNKEQYLSDDFNTKTNMKKWLNSIPVKEAEEYCQNLLKKRKEKKELIYTPTQVELRSILCPPIQFFQKLFGDYYKFCSNLGFKNKYILPNDIVEGHEWKSPIHKIFIDTREQKPLKFKRPIEIRTLKYGDYAFSSKTATCNCYIERKALSDFIGTMSGGYERFINEIKRAEEDGAYLVVLVEEKFQNAVGFKFLPHISKKIKATPEFIFHRVRRISQKYPHVQFLFVNGRKEATRVVEKIFMSGCIHEKADLQLAYDMKKL